MFQGVLLVRCIATPGQITPESGMDMDVRMLDQQIDGDVCSDAETANVPFIATFFFWLSACLIKDGDSYAGRGWSF